LPTGHHLPASTPPAGYALQETVTVLGDGSAISSTTTLGIGVNYKLRVSGTFTVGPGILGDAEYAFVGSFVENNCGNTPAGVDLGIGVDDTANSTAKSPYWGPYDANHVYTIDFLGKGQSITLNYHDCNYLDNVGSLTVEIFAPVVTPSGVPKLLDFEDLAVGTHVYNQYPSVTFVGGNMSNPSGSAPVTIVQPALGTASPTQAVQGLFERGCEFCGSQMTLKFDVAQYRVSLSTGLTGTQFGQTTMLLQAFDSDPSLPGNTLLAEQAAPCMGTGPTAINTPLEVDDGAARIHYVRLAIVSCSFPYDASSGADNVALVLDNLLYDRALNPPAGEHVPPVITIITPSNGATVSDNAPGSTFVRVHAAVTETALYSMTARANGGAPVPATFFQTGPQTYDANVILTDMNGIVSGTNMVVLTASDFDQPQNTGTASVTFHYQVKPFPPPVQVDFWPTAYEVNQTIDMGPQRLGPDYQYQYGYIVHVFDHPLVQGKATLVRIYGAASGINIATSGVPAVMDVDLANCVSNCTVAHGLAPVLLPNVPNTYGITVQPFGAPGSDPNNAAPNLALTWNFLLQPDWTKHDLVVTVQINDGNYSGLPQRLSVPECANGIAGECFYNNQVKLYLHFVPPPEITITPVYIHVTGSYRGQVYNDVKPMESQVDAIFQQINELYPAKVQRGPRHDITVDPGINKDDLLGRIQNFYGYDPCLAQPTTYNFYIGIFPGDQGNFNFAANEKQPDGSFVAGYGTVGVPFCGSPGAWANADNPIDPAHELGHNIGFDHWGCENGVNNDECGVFPIQHAGIGGVGLDLANWRVIPPGDNSSNSTPHAHDLMSYGQLCSLYGGGPGCDLGEWVSWYDYNILLNHPNINSYDTDDPPALLVSGRILTTGVATFRPIYQVNVGTPIVDSIAEDSADAIYTLRGTDSRGNTLFVHNFEPTKLDTHTADFGKSFTFDQPVPVMPNLQTITLQKGGQVLGTLTNLAPGMVPNVSILAPIAGTVWPAGMSQTIHWTESSPAGLPLRALLQYSPDGGATRIPLGRDITTTALTVNTDELTGSTNAYIYVQVSDGMNTATAQVGPFTVAVKAPSVHIVSPQVNSVAVTHVPLTLVGTAYDRQEALADSAYHWASSRDGVLGSGPELTVLNLSPGLHTLTLTVVDSHGRMGHASVQLRVVYAPVAYLPRVAR
jgi:hypothetical protein